MANGFEGAEDPAVRRACVVVGRLLWACATHPSVAADARLDAVRFVLRGRRLPVAHEVEEHCLYLRGQTVERGHAAWDEHAADAGIAELGRDVGEQRVLAGVGEVGELLADRALEPQKKVFVALVTPLSPSEDSLSGICPNEIRAVSADVADHSPAR